MGKNLTNKRTEEKKNKQAGNRFQKQISALIPGSLTTSMAENGRRLGPICNLNKTQTCINAPYEQSEDAAFKENLLHKECMSGSCGNNNLVLEDDRRRPTVATFCSFRPTHISISRLDVRQQTSKARKIPSMSVSV